MKLQFTWLVIFFVFCFFEGFGQVKSKVTVKLGNCRAGCVSSTGYHDFPEFPCGGDFMVNNTFKGKLNRQFEPGDIIYTEVIDGATNNMQGVYIDLPQHSHLHNNRCPGGGSVPGEFNYACWWGTYNTDQYCPPSGSLSSFDHTRILPVCSNRKIYLNNLEVDVTTELQSFEIIRNPSDNICGDKSVTFSLNDGDQLNSSNIEWRIGKADWPFDLIIANNRRSVTVDANMIRQHFDGEPYDFNYRVFARYKNCLGKNVNSNVATFYLMTPPPSLSGQISKVLPTCPSSKDGSITIPPLSSPATGMHEYTLIIDLGGGADNNVFGINRPANEPLTINGLGPGVYTLQIKSMEAPKCASETSFVLGNQSTVYNIATQPPTSVSVCSGESANFSLVAEGAVGSYQWEVRENGNDFIPINDGGIYSGSRSSSLNISNTLGLDGFQYRCIVAGRCGGESIPSQTIVSNTTTLTVVSPSVEIQTSSPVFDGGKVCLGSEVIYKAEPNVEGLNPSYQWFANGIAVGTNSSELKGEFNANMLKAVYCVMTPGQGVCKDNTYYSNSISISTINIHPGTISGPSGTVCYNSAPSFNISGASANGGDGQFSYQLQRQIAGNWEDAAQASSNTAIEASAAITNTTSYRHTVTTSGCPEVIGNTITVNVGTDISPGEIQVSSDYICQNDTAPLVNSNSFASGPSGSFNYTWYKGASEDALSEPGSGELVDNASGPILAPGELSSTTFFKRRAVSGDCPHLVAETNPVPINVHPPLTPGTISNPVSNPICYNTSPGLIASATDAAGGGGINSYKWLYSINGTNFIDIHRSDAEKLNPAYQPNSLTVNTQFKRRAESDCGSVETDPILIEVYEDLDPGTISGPTRVCYESSSVRLESSANGAPSGGNVDAGYTFQWQKSLVKNGTYIDLEEIDENGEKIPEDGESYISESLARTTWFKRKVTSGDCGPKFTDPIKVDVVHIAAKINLIDEIKCHGYETGKAQVVFDDRHEGTEGGSGNFEYNWSENVSEFEEEDTSIAKSLSAGTYSATIKDKDYDCTSGEVFINLTQPTPIVKNSLSPKSPNCIDGNDGSITISATGGTPGLNSEYSYTISTDLSNPLKGNPSTTFNNLEEGYYDITIKDENLCSLRVEGIKVEENSDSLRIELIQFTNNKCYDATEGTIEVKASYGTPISENYTYFLINSSDTLEVITTNGIAKFDSLSVGDYSIVVKDNYCDITSEVITISQPSQLTLTAIPVRPTCPNDENGDGKIEINIQGGTESYAYYFREVPSLETEVDLGNATFNSIDPESSFENLVVNGQTRYYKIFVRDNEWSSSRPELCQANVGVELQDQHAYDVHLEPTPNSCFGVNDGKLEVAHVIQDNVNIAADKLSYVWDIPNHPSSVNLSKVDDIPHGGKEYDVTITHNVGEGKSCQITRSVNFSSPQKLVIDEIITYPVSCSETENGTAVIEASGGTGAYFYKVGDREASDEKAIVNLLPGDYNLEVFDANNCKAESSFTINQGELGLSIKESRMVSCIGLADGEVIVEVVGDTKGTLWYAIDENAFQPYPVFEKLPAGTYTITVQDRNDNEDVLCEGQIEVTIEEPENEISANVETLSEEYCGNANAVIKVTAEGGNLVGYTFQIHGMHGEALAMEEGELVLEGLSKGTYSYTVMDNKGCADSAGFTIANIVPVLTADVNKVRQPYCGRADGAVEVVVSGHTHELSYEWPEGIENQGASAQGFLANTDYEVIITESVTGCALDYKFSLDAKEALAYTLINKEDSRCGYDDGSFSVQVHNGVAPYTFTGVLEDETLEVDGGEVSVSGLGAGAHGFNIIDATGCVMEGGSVSLSDRDGPQEVELDLIAAFCNQENGRATVIAVDDRELDDFEFTWKKNSSVIVKDVLSVALSAGKYDLQVKDKDLGCTLMASFEIADDLSRVPALEVESTFQAACNKPLGGATVSLIGDAAAEAYEWFDNKNNPLNVFTADISGLAKGKYKAWAKDVKGCEASVVVEITDRPDPVLIFSENTTRAACGKPLGSARVLAGPENREFTYYWKKSGAEAYLDQNSAIAIELYAGSYSVYARDEHGCASNTYHGIQITEYAPLRLTTSVDRQASCEEKADGRARVHVSGGLPEYQYAWIGLEQSSALATGLAKGTYTVRVTDKNTCQQEASVTVGTMAPLQVINTQLRQPLCQGDANGSIEVWISGGSGSGTYQYGWEHNANINASKATGLAFGNYKVTVTDANECRLERSFALDQPTAVGIDQLTATAPSCHQGSNGAISSLASGGTGNLTYSWNTGQTGRNIVGLSPATYTLTVKDQNQCTVIGQVEVPNPPPIEVQNVVKTLPACFGDSNGSIELTVINASNPLVRWPSGQVGMRGTNLAAGTYALTISDNKGCSLNTSVSLDNPPQLVITAIEDKEPTCFGFANGSLEVFAQGGTGAYTYRWSNNRTTKEITGLRAGNFSVEVRDAKGCRVNQAKTLGQPNALAAINKEVVTPSCNGYSDGKIAIEVSGGMGVAYDISWSNGVSGLVNPNLVAGDYTATIIDGNECRLTHNVRLSQPGVLRISNHTINHPSCYGDCNGMINMTLVGGTQPYQVQWQHDAGQQNAQISSLCPGSYNVVVSDQKGCKVERAFTINETPEFRIARFSNIIPDCYGDCNGRVEVVFSGGSFPYAYQWASNNQQLNVNHNRLQDICAGEYDLVIRDNNDCRVEGATSLANPPELKITGIPESSYMCEGSALRLDAGSIWQTYSWTSLNGFNSTQRQVEIRRQGNYNLSTVSTRGCTDTFDFEVEFSPDILRSDFLLASQAYAGDTVVLVDITWPSTDRIEWELEPGMEIYKESDGKIKIIFRETGEYHLGMYAFLDECQSYASKRITVLEYEENSENPIARLGYKGEDVLVSIYPNPNQGRFNVKVDLQKEAEVLIGVLDMYTGRVIREFNGKGEEKYATDFDIERLKAGIYLIKVETQEKVILKRFVVY
jgi:hypothetical protein